MSTCIWFQLVFLTVLFKTNTADQKTCKDHIIPLEDVQNAFLASKAVYDDNLQVGEFIPKSNFKITFQLESLMSSGQGVRVLIGEEKNATIIAFRGISGVGQLADAAWQVFKKFSGNLLSIEGTMCRVNAYFYDAFDLLYKQIRNKLRANNRKYIVTGHSMGGALGSLLAITSKFDDDILWKNPESSLITFGQPRVGDKNYAKKHDQVLSPNRKLRIVMDRDPVPHIPSWPAVHHSREIWIAKKAFSKPKKWLWKVCAKLDPFRCSNRWALTPNLKDHEIASYEKRIMNPPDLYYDEKYKKYTSWSDAVKGTCVN